MSEMIIQAIQILFIICFVFGGAMLVVWLLGGFWLALFGDEDDEDEWEGWDD